MTDNTHFMCDEQKKNVEQFKMDIRHIRDQWKKIRADRLKRKGELLVLGYDKRKIRTDKIFKKLRKEQDRLSKLIKHAEKRLNRIISGKNL